MNKIEEKEVVKALPIKIRKKQYIERSKMPQKMPNKVKRIKGEKKEHSLGKKNCDIPKPNRREVISCLVKRSPNSKFDHQKIEISNDDFDADDNDYLISPRLFVNNNSKVHNQRNQIDTSKTLVEIKSTDNRDFQSNYRRKLINSRSKTILELKEDKNFYKNLQLLAKSKKGFRNIPFSRLMKLPLDFSSILNYESPACTSDRLNMSNNSVYQHCVFKKESSLLPLNISTKPQQGPLLK